MGVLEEPREQVEADGGGATTGGVPWFTASVLVLANAVLLWAALAWGWDLFTLIFVCWVENVLVGAYALLRLLTAVPEGRPWLHQVALVPVFCVHYGLFLFVHGALIYELFGSVDVAAGLLETLGPHILVRMIEHGLWVADPRAALALLALGVSHGVSYAVNFLGGGEYRRTSAGALMWQPYDRVVVLHVILLFGASVAKAFGEYAYTGAALVLLKIILDLWAHVREHRPRVTPPAPAAE